jgi:hypothetical protein
MKGLIIPQGIKTFNSALVTEYVEQQELPTTGNRSPGLSVRGDAVIPNNVDKNNEAQFPDSGDCGCDGSSGGISFEYKILVVLILIIMIWTFVGWRHHHMVAHH